MDPVPIRLRLPCGNLPPRGTPPLRRGTPRSGARAAPLTAEDTALPGRMLMLLSRLHRSELQLQAEAEKAGAQGA